jgi:hypothetical protein
MTRTQCDVVLDVLRDGHWHSTRELQEAGGGLRVPSRVDELRKLGFTITCRREARGIYVYRLGGDVTRDARPAPPRPIDECVRCGRRAELVDADALYCAGCVEPAGDEKPSPPAQSDGQLVFLDRAMRRSEVP